MATENRFLKQITPQESPVTEQTPQESGNRFLNQLQGKTFDKGESFLKSGSRTLLQPALGYAKKFTWPADIFQMIGQGEALAEFNELQERIPELQKKFPQAPWENFQGLDPEKYMEAIQASSSLVPTQGNVEKWIEESTGIPLQAKTGIQHAARLGGTAAGFRPGGLSEKLTAGVVAPAATKALEIAGVPEPVAEIIGLGASGVAPSPSISKVVKPSGLTTRRFEGLQKPTKVTAARHEKITESVEKDFKKIADKILEKNKTYSAMKEDNLFKEKISDLFDEVDVLARGIKKESDVSGLRNVFREKAKEKFGKGLTPNEFERAYRKEYKRISKELPFGTASAEELVDQFRKNNGALKELFEPGKSSAFNRAKKESLLDYNRSIEQVIKESYPESEFKNLFEFTNKRWKEINDLENIEEFMGDLFKGKINYKEARKLFDERKGYISKPFKAALGHEGFKNFKTLVEDLLSSEKAYSMLKKAEKEGFSDLVKMGGPYLISPKLGLIHSLSALGKKALKATLSNPKISITWKSALDNLKRGAFKEAQQDFKDLEKEVQSIAQKNIPQDLSKQAETSP